VLLKKNKPHRNRAYLDWLREQPCVFTGRSPRDPAHIRMGADGGMGMKSSDFYALPVCPEYHRDQHQHGEATFWVRMMNEHTEAVMALIRDGARWRYEEWKK